MWKLLICLMVTGVPMLVGQQPSSAGNPHIIKPAANEQVGKNFENRIVTLDGLVCKKCSFTNVTLLYSGGAYNLVDATFRGTIAVELHGSAQNAAITVATLAAKQPKSREVITFNSPKTMSLKSVW